MKRSVENAEHGYVSHLTYKEGFDINSTQGSAPQLLDNITVRHGM